MAYYKKLVWDRIYLSPKTTSEEEIDKYTKWFNDFQVTDYLTNSSDLFTYNSEKERLENDVKCNENTRNFGIITLDWDNLIWWVWLNHISSVKRSATFWIYIWEEEYRSHGYGTEATNLILEFAFKYLNLHRVDLRLVAINERAHKCYLKCGFKDFWRAREEIFVNWKYYDSIYMDILESEFKGDFIRNKNL